MPDKVAKNSNLVGRRQGRPKGAPNKATAELKDMILGALHASGGQDYLKDRANDPRTQAAFLALIGKVLPMQITGKDGQPVQTVITWQSNA
jgi:hypothetical protein